MHSSIVGICKRQKEGRRFDISYTLNTMGKWLRVFYTYYCNMASSSCGASASSSDCPNLLLERLTSFSGGIR